MRWRVAFLTLVFSLFVLQGALAQGNGKLQIHFMDVGQGDGAVLVSPQGEVVLFDDGVKDSCTKPVNYLQSIGVTKVDYHIASHYHADHIGCAAEMLTRFPLQRDAYDRGGAYNSGTFDKYVQRVGAKRKTATGGMTITLDSNSAQPVTIKVVALNGDGIETTNENDLSLVAVAKFGEFEAVIGGDLSGYKEGSYEDIETSVAPKVGQVEVYKVHHHCSRYSTNSAWIQTIQPKIGIVSVGNGNGYGHPTQECLEKLHNAGVRAYWTEAGAGAAPEPGRDVVAGSVVVQMQPGAQNFTVSYGGTTDTFPLWGSAPATLPKYAWSKKSGVYHLAGCRYVANIKAENLERGDAPPPGETLHQLCPSEPTPPLWSLLP